MSIYDEGPLLTTDPQVFVQSLESGDVLLFDSLKSLSGLVQWADAAPVNHAGLWAGDGYFVHANSNGDPSHAVKLAQLSPLLTNIVVHTVVALRYNSADAHTRALPVQQAQQYVGGPFPFAEVDLILLAPLALIRAYSWRLGTVMQRVLGCGAEVWWRLLERRKRKRTIHDFTCSAFVMECFDAAGLEVKVDSVRPGPGINPFEPPDREQAMAEAGKLLSGGTHAWEIAAWRSLRTLKERYSDHGKQQSAAGDVTDRHREAVSPGDIWRSSSFLEVSIYINRAVGLVQS
jgi:hypothetical protein